MASAIIFWQVWRFITPGLYAREKRLAIPFVASAFLLFALGAVTAWLTFPKTLQFFAAFGGPTLTLLYTPGKYISLLTVMMLVFALAFLFPILLVFLQLAGVLSWRRLSSWRRYGIVVIFVVGAVITPSGDPITLIAIQKSGDLVRRHGPANVGLLTGDNAVNGDAPIVVMTGEVVRNMIYASPPALRGLRYVVLD